MSHINVACIIPLGPNEPVPDRLIQSLLDQQLPVTVSATMPKPAELALAVDWVSGAAGRAAQLNRGVQARSERWLWLIHADSEIPPQACGAVQAFCQAADECTIGHGQLRFANDGPRLVQLNAWGAYLRTKWFNQPYGDQTLCINRHLWQQLDGFTTTLDRGEDLDFIIRARKLRAITQALPFTVITSARRYQTHGWLRTTINHQIKAYHLIKQAKQWQP